MSQSLPEHSSLEHLKAQAKDLIAAYRAGDPDAERRIHGFFPHTVPPSLSETQLVLAREYGFDSWTRLKAQVMLLGAGTSLTRRADQLARMAINGQLETVMPLLTGEPALTKATIAAACVTGELTALQAFLAAEPALLHAQVGPKQWEPLLYVCYSCLLKSPSYRSCLVATARWLLDQGADPNAHWLNADWDNTPESCLYGAVGVSDCPPLAEMLLQAGANPNDGESLYHAAELPESTCFDLLLDYGADAANETNALAHLPDREAPDWPRRMLATVKDPTQIPPVLPHALRRGRSAEVFQVLIASGMSLESLGDSGLPPFNPRRAWDEMMSPRCLRKRARTQR